MNTLLQSQFGDVLDQVDAWFWGHEHNLEIYGPYLGLERGRCIGCAAVPVFVAQDPYKVCAGGDKIPLLPANPAIPGVPVMLGSTGGVYNHGYVILKLDDAGGTATVSYYQDTGLQDTGIGDLLFQETLGAINEKSRSQRSGSIGRRVIRGSDLDDVVGGGALVALDDVVLHAVTLGERLEAAALDRRVVDETVLLTVLRRDEPETLAVVEPLHSSGVAHS